MTPDPSTPALTSHPAGLRPAGRALHHACAAVAWGVLHPARLPSAVTPRLLGLPYRSFRIRSGEQSLAAWHIPAPEPSRRGLVLCHGHNDARSQFLPLLRPLHRAGFHLLLFDFRAMGLSSGRHCTYGYHEQEDVLAGLRWIREEAGVERVGLLGYSMGGACALLAAARDPDVAAVATDCAFARLEDMVQAKYRMLPPALREPVGNSVRYWAERWVGEVTAAVDPEAAVGAWKPRPLLVIHGERDLLVPPDHARRLARAAGQDAELWVVPGAGHVASRRWARREYVPRLTRFFRRHLGD